MRVSKSANETLALSNCIIVSPRDFGPECRYLLLENDYVFTMKVFDAFPPGELGTSVFHRRWANLSLNQEVRIRPYDPYSGGMNVYLGNLTLQV